MSVTVIYGTEPNLARNGGKAGKTFKKDFPSVDDAKSAPMRKDVTHAFIQVEDGQHSFRAGRGWEFLSEQAK